ncbi:MAG: ATP-binding cassette domain-containing protein [Streptosporangiales bacterium]|nr:ATP-binding cassette domain-containing protein [Streptosporangiales bacterium]
MANMIEAEGLVKRYGKTVALGGVDLVVPEGRVLGLLGPNGAGKTTAVRVLSTLLRPDEGRATVGGYDVVRQAHDVRRLIGLTGQYASVDEELTGTQNLVMIGRLLEMSRSAAKARARELLERFELTDAAGRRAKTYSGGMRRKLDLAASLVGNPSVLYLDEPTTGLDPYARREVWEVIRALVSGGATVLLTTQYLDEAERLADEITVFDKGVVVASGSAPELKRRVGGQTLRVRARDESDLVTLTAIVAEVTATAPTRESDGMTVAAPTEDPGMLLAVVRRLDAAGLVVDELTLGRPSLDDVFLALTGHRAEDADTTTPAVPEGSLA